ncbi:MAG TPA: glutathione S-transferase [Paracoccaceae bacterium]|nr:glutathione S-transferase [Paracoccaceae bacterium]HMO72249.1 glutathione S-transferase [Paracoccaceae bacterium]
MRLYHSPTSPFARKVMVLLHEAGRTAEVALVPASGSPLAAGPSPVGPNPLGKLPCLLREDGGAIFDSRVICRWLDDRFAAGLYPPARLWDVLVLESLADGMLDAALLMVYETRVRPQEARFAPWVEGQWAKIDRTLDHLENAWLSRLKGPVDMGQVAVGCALGYLDFRHPGRDWRAGRPGLDAWALGFAARPSMAATAPADR